MPDQDPESGSTTLIFPDSDIVCFLTGLLLGPDPASRAWLSQWVRAGQKRRACAALAQLRQEQCCQLAEI
jgi:hypothetical protein